MLSKEKKQNDLLIALMTLLYKPFEEIISIILGNKKFFTSTTKIISYFMQVFDKIKYPHFYFLELSIRFLPVIVLLIDIFYFKSCLRMNNIA